MSNAFTKNQSWTYCKPSVDFKPSRWLANDFAGGGVRITFQSMTPPASSDIMGKVARSATITFKGKDIKELAAAILEEFPKAVFSNVPKDEIKEAYEAARNAEAYAQGARDWNRSYDSAYDAEVAKLTPAQREEGFLEAVTQFISNKEFSSPEWVARFAAEPECLRYPFEDNKPTNRNYTVLKQYLEAVGKPVPQSKDIAAAINKLANAGCFYQQKTYKRSEQARKNAVRPYTAAVEQQIKLSDELKQETLRRLTSRGIPVKVTVESIVEVWAGKMSVEDAEILFDTLKQQHAPSVPGNIKSLTREQIAQELHKGHKPNDVNRQYRW